MSSDPWTAAEPAYLHRVLAPNPGPMTLQGTNTWVVGDPAGGPPVVVDPGPRDAGHLQRVLARCGGRIATIVLTHRHLDHSEGAARLAELGRCRVRAVDPAWATDPAGLRAGAVIESPGVTLEVVATPGHTSDSVSLLLVGADRSARLLTGDTVLGQGTTVIAEPDGDLGAYLESLARLRRVADASGVTQILPGHGPVVDDPAAVLETYVTHRLARLDQVRAALDQGAVTPADVVAAVYAEVDRSLWPAAEQSVRAQLAYLRDRA